MAFKIVGDSDTSVGSKAQNAEFFGSDLTLTQPSLGNGAIWHCQFSASDACNVDVTFDSGTNWTELTALVTDTLVTIDIYVARTDQVNFRQDNVAARTIDINTILQEE